MQAEEVEGPIDHNVVVQLFLPLITSQRYMLEQRSDPYEVIELEDDTMYMFEQVVNQACTYNGDIVDTLMWDIIISIDDR